MADVSFTLTGGDLFRKRLQAAPAKVQKAVRAATKESLKLLETRAKAKLDAEIYSKSDSDDLTPPDKSGADSLWASFAQELAVIGGGAFSAQLLNTSSHAWFIEAGTDNEGTGSHYVAAIKGAALAWMDAKTGEMAFAKGIEVKGIHPYRFMEKTLFESRDDVSAIFRKHAKKILR